MGTLLVNGILSTVNLLYSAEEMKYQFELTASKVIVTHIMALERVIQATSSDTKIIVFDEGLPSNMILTGRSKGVMITHHNLIANILQTVAYEGFHLFEKNATLLIPLSFFHIFGFTAGMMMAAYAGTKHIFFTTI
jgi:hypothetical protein